MKKIVLINVDFIDAYTGDLHKAGDREAMTEARIAEVKAVNPEFVTVIGSATEPVQADETEPVIEPIVEPVKAPKKSGKKAE